MARGQQQTRRAPGRPLADPDAEAARQEAWLARQEAAEEPSDPAQDASVAAEAAGVAELAAASGEVAVPVAPEPSPASAVAAPLPPPQTLSPLDQGTMVDLGAGSPRYFEGPTMVRTGDGAFRSQGVDARVAAAPIPATDPTEVRDVYVVPDGVIAPENDPSRPDPADAVLVGDAAQLVATGAWASLPGGTSIVTTRKVLRVWWPMGTLSPCYSTVADRGVVLPKPTTAA